MGPTLKRKATEQGRNKGSWIGFKHNTAVCFRWKPASLLCASCILEKNKAVLVAQTVLDASLWRCKDMLAHISKNTAEQKGKRLPCGKDTKQTTVQSPTGWNPTHFEGNLSCGNQTNYSWRADRPHQITLSACVYTWEHIFRRESLCD